MQIEGRWLAGADGVERPVFDGYRAAPGGVQIAVSLLIDTGADFTVLAPDGAHQLAGVVAATATSTLAAEVGGTQQVYELAFDVLLPTTSGHQVRSRGRCVGNHRLQDGCRVIRLLGRHFEHDRAMLLRREPDPYHGGSLVCTCAPTDEPDMAAGGAVAWA